MEFRLTFKVIVGAFVEGLRGARQTGDWIGQERGVTSFSWASFLPMDYFASVSE